MDPELEKQIHAAMQQSAAYGNYNDPRLTAASASGGLRSAGGFVPKMATSAPATDTSAKITPVANGFTIYANGKTYVASSIEDVTDVLKQVFVAQRLGV